MRTPVAGASPNSLLARQIQREAASGLPGLGRPSATAGLGFPAPVFPAAAIASAPPVDLEATAEPSSGPTPDHLYQLGLTTAAMGFHTAAIEALRACTERAPDHSAAWRELGELLRLANLDEEARAADAAADRAETTSAQAAAPSGSRFSARPDKAERKLQELLQRATPEKAMTALRDRLVANPRDVAAMRFLARLEGLAGDFATSWRLLERALGLCPDYVGALEDYAVSLMERRSQAASAAKATKQLLDRAPRSPRYREMHAFAMMYVGRLEVAVDLLAGLVREHPRTASYWRAYAQALHFIGRREESERAFRKCLELEPDMGEAYWGLADLKGRAIGDADLAAIRAALQLETLESGKRMHMLYALGHTLERAGDFEASFAAYREGAQLFRAAAERRGKGHDRALAASRVRRAKAVFSHENLAGRLAPTTATPDITPIFIVGMPRAGSTLVEQILASHSQVEGTRELPLIGDVTRALTVSRILVNPDAYPECLLDLPDEALVSLGAGVIERARDYRRTDRPFFVDKRPWNWLEVGLIHLILPGAKIIDIRREPMAACFAMYKQLLPNDAGFSYDFEDLAAYYNNYVSLMDHWRSVLPGRVHPLQYESLVRDTEAEVRRLLDYCGLPFEEACLRFWETDRAVSTPSAEQVRQPIFRDALEQWRHFEPWLGDLRRALDQPAEV